MGVGRSIMVVVCAHPPDGMWFRKAVDMDLWACEVIGEHVGDPLRLLAIDPDGRLFAIDLARETLLPTELSDEWVVDITPSRPDARQLPLSMQSVVVLG